MWTRAVTGGIVLASMLACGGGGAGHSVSSYASKMATYYEDQNGVPCPTYGLGDEVTLGGFTYRFDKAEIMEPNRKTRSAYERVDFKDPSFTAVGVEYSIPWGKKYDASGRHKVDYVKEQAVIDLGMPPEGPAVTSLGQ